MQASALPEGSQDWETGGEVEAQGQRYARTNLRAQREMKSARGSEISGKVSRNLFSSSDNARKKGGKKQNTLSYSTEKMCHLSSVRLQSMACSEGAGTQKHRGCTGDKSLPLTWLVIMEHGFQEIVGPVVSPEQSRASAGSRGGEPRPI